MTPKKKPLIGIIGGEGKMGNWFKNFFISQDLEVIISDLNTQLSNKELAKKADIVIVSVPIKETVKVIKEVRDLVRKDALLSDLTSLKVEPVKTMKKAKSGILGMHPLFGPLVQNLRGQRIVFCRVRDNHWVNFLRNLFEKNGTKIIEISPEDHDYQMAIIQALVHFLNINLARTIATQKTFPKSHFLTPVSRLQSLILGRILAQNPRLYAEIEIENPFFQRILADFEKKCKDLSQDIRKKDFKSFIKKFKKASFFLKDFLKVAETKSSEILKIVETQPVKWGFDKKVELKAKGLKIGYLGPKGTFSFEASQRIFSPKSEFFSFPTIREIFEAVNNNEIDFGVVPAENTIGGIVPETINCLIEYPLKVIGSYNLPIHHSLLSWTKSKAHLKIIKTNPQAFSQCRSWLEKNLPGVSFESSFSTTAPILETLENKRKEIGFIANKMAAKEYKLNILAENIEDSKDNITKFYLLTKNINENITKKLKPKKTLFLLAVYDRAGVLRDILNVFADNNINLSSLHSIPSKLKPWDYFFFIQADIFLTSPILKKVLAEIKKFCPIVRIIGAS